MYLSSQLSLRLHGMHSFHSYPWIIRSGGFVDALGPEVAQRQVDDDAKVTLRCRGFNDRDLYPRQTPCDQDYLRKLARDTCPDELELVFVCLTYSLLQLHLLQQGHEALNRRTWRTPRRLLPDGDRVIVEVGMCGSPFAGWGVPLWKGTPDRSRWSMNDLLEKLPQFPQGTLVSINQGFNPDCLPAPHPAQHFPLAGGDGRLYAKRAAKIHTVLTWDYSVTEGEGTVMPHCRVRRIFQRRREEAALGCYSGGICYTMSPKLNCQSIFCCAEAHWNPHRRPEDVLIDSGDFLQEKHLSDLTAEIRRLDMRKLCDDYWNRVYGIYNHIPHPGDPRAQGVTQNVVNRFHYELAVLPGGSAR